jgi:hypothetical protein
VLNTEQRVIVRLMDIGVVMDCQAINKLGVYFYRPAWPLARIQDLQELPSRWR